MKYILLLIITIFISAPIQKATADTAENCTDICPQQKHTPPAAQPTSEEIDAILAESAKAIEQSRKNGEQYDRTLHKNKMLDNLVFFPLVQMIRFILNSFLPYVSAHATPEDLETYKANLDEINASYEEIKKHRNQRHASDPAHP